MNRTSIVVASLLAIASPVAVAHAEPPPQMAELSPLIGRWQGSGTSGAAGQEHALTASYACESTAAGFAVKCHGEMRGIPGLDPYVWDDLWGYSAGDGLFHWYTVTNAGETHDHRGLVKGGHVYVQFDGPQDGMLFSEGVTIDFVPGKKLSFSWQGMLGGQSVDQGQVSLTPARS